ncbi:MAG: hypothetical protein N2V76_08160 [Methanophagales archaeon]|nr:hypothetical protein [Methanophagales archaeon]
MGKGKKLGMTKKRIILKSFLSEKKGYFRKTENDEVMEKVDEEGNNIVFSVLKVSALKEKPLFNSS